jgi:outer membrane lipoprotein-sorting protein
MRSTGGREQFLALTAVALPLSLIRKHRNPMARVHRGKAVVTTLRLPGSLGGEAAVDRLLGPPRSARRRRRVRWSVPLTVAVVIAVSIIAPRAIASGHAHPSLPRRSPAELFAALGRSGTRGLSGDLHTQSHLGLPQLPTTVGSSQLLDALTGTATWHFWIDGTSRQRLALLGSGQEIDTIRDGQSVWTWDSSTQTATHLTAAGALLTPQSLARWARRSIRPGTVFGVGPTEVVAGRPAYDLQIDPRSRKTLLSRIDIAVDAATGTPLQVQLWSAEDSTQPAFAVGFTSVALDRPPAAVFTFSPPAGARVRTDAVTSRGVNGSQGPRAVGSGWGTVVVASAGGPGASTVGGRSTPGGSLPLAAATRVVPGGRLLSTTLFSMLTTDSGQVLIGAVPAARLEAVAARLATGPTRS